MRLHLIDDTPAGPLLRRQLSDMGYLAGTFARDDLILSPDIAGDAVLLRVADGQVAIEAIEAIRCQAGDTVLILALAASPAVDATAFLRLYQAGADAVLPPQADAAGVRRTLEHLTCQATFCGHDEVGRRCLRQQADLVAPLLGTLSEHLGAISLLSDSYRLQISAADGALYALRVENGTPQNWTRLDDEPASPSLEQILRLDRGCYLLFADVDTSRLVATGGSPVAAV